MTTIEFVRNEIRNYRRLTVREVAHEVGISIDTRQAILSDKLGTEEQRERCIGGCVELKIGF